jgi:dolichyl-phosphate beta-glucosyltransferase
VSIRRTLVVPAFNESSRLRAGYERLSPVLALWGPETTELLFVDDGSTDDTLQEIANIYGHLPHVAVVKQPVNRGKGAAVRLGWASARGPHVLTVDADMAIDPRHYPAVDEALDHSPFVPGSRAVDGTIRYGSSLRTWAGAAFHRYVTHYTGTTVRDTQCGCKGLQLGLARVLGVFGMIDGFAYDAELFALCEQLAISPTPVSVTWDDVAGSTVRASATRQIARDVRGIPRTPYQVPALHLPPATTAAEVRQVAVGVRQRGLVLARVGDDLWALFPRDAGVNAITMAASLGATVGVVTPADLRGGTFEPV